MPPCPAAVKASIVGLWTNPILRALREIDRTLRVVKYAHAVSRGWPILQDLRVNNLLPPDLLFVVHIADSTGRIVASTRRATGSVAKLLSFQNQRRADSFLVGQPPAAASASIRSTVRTR